MKLLALVAFALTVQLAQAAELPGRIFFTPEQRAQLDTLRQQKAVASQARDEPIPETVTYNGIVRRSDGKTTVWVNDEALSETGLLNKQSIVGRVGRDGQITLQAAAVQLKVGQSATLFTGKVDESFAQRKVTAPKQGATETTDKASAKQAQAPDPQNTNKTSDPEANRQAAPKP